MTDCTELQMIVEKESCPDLTSGLWLSVHTVSKSITRLSFAGGVPYQDTGNTTETKAAGKVKKIYVKQNLTER